MLWGRGTSILHVYLRLICMSYMLYMYMYIEIPFDQVKFCGKKTRSGFCFFFLFRPLRRQKSANPGLSSVCQSRPGCFTGCPSDTIRETHNEAYDTFHFACPTLIELRREASVLYVCVCVANPWQGISGHFSIPGGPCYLTRTRNTRDPLPAAAACLGVTLPSSHINKYQAYNEVHNVHFNMQICKYLIISKRREFGILKMQSIPEKSEKNKVNWTLITLYTRKYKFYIQLVNLKSVRVCKS